MSRFSSLSEYEQFIYNLLQDFPAILRSTLVLVKRGRYFAEVRGELAFANDHRLRAHYSESSSPHRDSRPCCQSRLPHPPRLARNRPRRQP